MCHRALIDGWDVEFSWQFRSRGVQNDFSSSFCSKWKFVEERQSMEGLTDGNQGCRQQIHYAYTTMVRLHYNKPSALQ